MENNQDKPKKSGNRNSAILNPIQIENMVTNQEPSLRDSIGGKKNSIYPNNLLIQTKNRLLNKISTSQREKSNSSISDHNKTDTKSFARLQFIQKLLKKESSLKELFIKTSNETIKTIENECREIYRKKLEVVSQLQKLTAKENEMKKCVLLEEQAQKDNLKNLYTYIPKFLFNLWNEPKLVVKLLNNSNIKDVKNHLAPLIANNFYENILSINYVEENFLYILCLLIKEEIESLSSKSDVEKFLKDTPCGFLMDELINKNDIKSYFKTILQNPVENFEVNCQLKEMNFNTAIIEKEIQENMKKNNIKKRKNSKTFKPNDEVIFRKDLPNNKKAGKSSDKNLLDSSVDVRARHTNSNIPKRPNYSIINNMMQKEEEKSKEEEMFNIESYGTFSEKYTPDLTLKELKSRINTDENTQMKEYYNYQISNTKSRDSRKLTDVGKAPQFEEEVYSNEKFMDSVFNSVNSDMILFNYQYDFMNAITIIEDIFVSLLDNLPLLPYSIKCLCKIISILIKKKFPNISIVEENSFIAQFFFCKLFTPIFKNPAIFALINKYIISRKTITNLEVINQIILQLVSGKLYRNGGKNTDYTPFNWFFLDQMPSVFKFFDYLINKVKLPTFIEECLNDKLPENFTYDYFKENPDEIICHRSICFNINDIACLLENVHNCRKIFFPPNDNNSNTIVLKKSFEKLYDNNINQLIIKDLKNAKNFEKLDAKNNEGESKIPIIQYYLVTDFLYNNKYKHLFCLNQKTPQFNIKELTDIKNKEENYKNNVIKVKNYFSTLLYNYRTLVETDFEEGTTSNLINILKELKIFMKSSNFVIDGSIPSEWYIHSLIEYLNNLPEEYMKDDYEPIFTSLEKEVNESIKTLDFEILSICLNKTKYIRKNILYYDNTKEILVDIILNNKVKEIIEDTGFKVELIFNYEKDKKELIINKGKKRIKQLQFLDNMIFQNSSKKETKYCKSIEAFIQNFPNLYLVLPKSGGKDIFEVQNELGLPEKLDETFEYIKEYITSEKKIKDQRLFDSINEKIYDYVMSKIYDKIYPKEPNQLDYNVYEKTVSLSWIEPRHIIPEKKNYVYDTFLPDIINNFDLLDKTKSPRIKLKNMSNIFMTITNILKFNNSGKEDIGVDDLMPLLNYAAIKAQPTRLFSNCKFMELYIGNLKWKNEGSQLVQLQSICMRINDINYKCLYDVDMEEFDRKCFQCLNDKIDTDCEY